MTGEMIEREQWLTLSPWSVVHARQEAVTGRTSWIEMRRDVGDGDAEASCLMPETMREMQADDSSRRHERQLLHSPSSSIVVHNGQHSFYDLQEKEGRKARLAPSGHEA